MYTPPINAVAATSEGVPLENVSSQRNTDQASSRTSLVKILVCCHKPSEFIISTPPYVPIHAGKALHPEINLGCLTDDVGDNISALNARWSEWTALYWGWKNVHDVKYLGLCHYRRYFDGDLSDTKIHSLLKNRDIIVTPPVRLQCSVATRFGEWTTMEHVYLFITNLLRLHPEYKVAVDSFFNGNVYYKCTMFVARKEVYDDFCVTMIPVLAEVDKMTGEMPFSRQNRAIGYLGEVSLGLYIRHKHLRCRVVKDRIFIPPTKPESRLKAFMNRREITASLYLRIVGAKDQFLNLLHDVGYRLLTFADKRPLFNDAVVQGLRSDGYDF